jgi:hypothetical protein
VSKNPRERKPCTLYEGEHKGNKDSSGVFWGSLHLVSFPTRNAIAKLSRIHGFRKIVRIRLEILDFAKTHPVAVTCPR